MLKRLSLKHLALTLALIAAACAVPLQSVLVDQPAVQATVAPPATTLPPATQAPAVAVPTVPAPATLETSVLASLWDEDSETSSLLAVDPFTGEPLADYPPINLGEGFSSARSPDGRWLAAIGYGGQACDGWAGGTRCQPSDGVLHFVDLPAWQDTATNVATGTNASFMLFSPDSRTLAIGQSEWPKHSLLLVDVASGTRIAETALDFYPSQAAFSADGTRLMLYGPHYEDSSGFNPEPRVALLNAADLSLQWQQALPGVLDGQYVPAEANNVHDESVWWTPAVVFAPDAQRLYVVHADDDVLSTVDFAAQTVGQVEVGPARSWLDRLMALTAGVAEAKMLNGAEKQAVLSPDGQRLYVVGGRFDTRNREYSHTPLGLKVIGVATGVELQQVDGPAGVIHLAPDGRHLLLTDWDAGPVTDIFALDDLAPVRRLVGFETQVGATVNGQPVVFGVRHHPRSMNVYLLDPQTYAELAHWQGSLGLWLLP